MAISKKIKDVELVKIVANMYDSGVPSPDDSGIKYVHVPKLEHWSQVDVGLVDADAWTNRKLPSMGPELLAWALREGETNGYKVLQILIVKKPKVCIVNVVNTNG